ncbi:MAG: hypothetical protein WC538_07485 [Thermoanaerobaculia bacterium]|jgi:hypothetical protein
MELNFMFLEADGSLANPIAKAAFVTWLVVVVVGAILLALRSAKRSASANWVFIALVGLALIPFTKLAHGAIATALYNWPDGGVTSVGLWGGPPLLPAPILAVATFVVARHVARRRRASPAV